MTNLEGIQSDGSFVRIEARVAEQPHTEAERDGKACEDDDQEAIPFDRVSRRHRCPRQRVSVCRSGHRHRSIASSSNSVVWITARFRHLFARIGWSLSRR